ncbi:SDR family NAD(P)-dependent oxidoreductase [Actinacidiphila sp. bgisy160]|uniref:SDR family NAD(P)-dependent oxidoreductase n=1 Tax=Actinacidiphila sp. bgisy160 TaxID=3413796 RepID=UPI003D73A620
MPDQPLLQTPFSSHATASEVITGVDLTGRRALVTGGASGIGLETVRALASAGADVTVATRDPAAAAPALRAFAATAPAGSVDVRALDLADLASVARFARTWSGPLDILVANAGIMALPTRQVTGQGWELQLATNHLGHFALATALHPELRAAGSARLVVVSSGAHRNAAFDFDDPHFEQRPYDPWTAYAQSKTADVLLAVGARRWAADGITANALNPGWILTTNLQRHIDADTMRAMGVTDEDGTVIPQPYHKTAEQGAATSVLLAASPLLDGVTGRYFEDNQEAPVVHADEEHPGGVAPHAVDPLAADRLWDRAMCALRM